ncbi:MAG: glycosyltransferase family 4 protein [Candidatus Yonathbacteria bacterium]|nr:glycosyltransferase family 4 protein [Candidatus Yonathbacteria bacterium]
MQQKDTNSQTDHPQGEKRRIVFFTDRLSPAIGGMEAHADAFIEHFSSHTNWRISVVVTFEKGVIPSNQGVTGSNREEGARISVPIKYLPRSSIFDPQEIYSIIDSLKLLSGDIIFFNSLYWVRIMSALHARYPHVRIILRSGGNDIIQSQIDGAGKKLSMRRQFVATMINSSTYRLIVNSCYSFDALSMLGIDKERMQIVSGGVDISHFANDPQNNHDALRRELSLPPNIPIILAVCRFVPFKGLEYSIRAMYLLPPTLQFHYVILGDGPLRKELTLLIKTCGLSKRVTLHHAVRHEDTPHYFRAADIYCLTPIYYPQKVEGGEYIHTETMGRSFCEAAAASLPSVSTQVGGIPEIVKNGETGLLVPERSSECIAKSLQVLLSDDALRKRMGKRARTVSEQDYSWNTVFEAYCNIFQK